MTLTVWFDSGCPLCRREIALMRLLDWRRAISFIDIEQDQSCSTARRDLLARFHAQDDGKIVSGAAAFAAMWRAIPIMRPLGLLARNRVVLAALERLYIAFLAVRPRLTAWARKKEADHVQTP